MRKFQRNQILDIVKTIYDAHDLIKKQLKAKNIENVCNILADCQNTAIHIGESIEKSEGEGHIAVSYLEEYCEELYQVSLIVNDEDINANNIVKHLDKAMIKAENSIKTDIKAKYEIVFMPYKASMWDSMESVWQTADKDPNCDAYVVPIPYYDRNKDMSLGKYHYEGMEFPSYVPIVSSYDIEKRRPDVIYIHNPYDEGNLVTSIDPKYYSEELKKYTDCLVYIPYFSVNGMMSEFHGYFSVYYNADYIVTQADYYKKFFDKTIPEKKFLPLGSPKFDRVVNICKNPPAAPLDWQMKMMGKKVYFFNTSISGMLGDTASFIKKLSYVFKCFINHPEVCLLWRPHPLLESTFESMRPQYLKEFRALKQLFISKNLGIYDETPDVEMSLALSDAYIGDTGSSLVTMFGVTGKPIFILNNHINTEPTTDDCLGTALTGIYTDSNTQHIIAQGNQLYYSEKNDFNYKHLCQISRVLGDYSFTLKVQNKVYIMPVNTQELGIFNNGVLEKIKLRQTESGHFSFYAMLKADKYIIILPNKYPYIVRFNTQNREIKYFEYVKDVFVQTINNERHFGGYCVKKDLLFIASPTDDRVFVINIKTGQSEVSSLAYPSWKGTAFISCNGNEMWFMPYKGKSVLKYSNDDVTEYDCDICGLKCINPSGYACENLPFGYPAFTDEYVYLPAYWANMFIKINKNTGEVSEYIPPIENNEKYKNGYYYSSAKYNFTHKTGKNKYLLYSYYERAIYEINLKEDTARKIEVKFDENELKAHEKGFDSQNMYTTYSCMESAFNSLEDFIMGNITGKPFDKELLLKECGKISNNIDGTCGEKIHNTIIGKIGG